MSNIDELIVALIKGNRQSSESAKAALLAIGPEAVCPLLATLPNTDAKGHWKIITLLAKLHDPRAVPTVAGFLYADSTVLRTAAAQCLGEIGDQQAMIPLLAALNDNLQNGPLVWIVQALGQLGDPRAVDALLKVMHETESPAARYTAIEALTQIGDRRAIKPIKQYLNDPSHHVRDRVAMALARLGDEEMHAVSGTSPGLD